MKEQKKGFEHVKQLLIVPPVLCMLTENDKLRLESNTNKTTV